MIGMMQRSLGLRSNKKQNLIDPYFLTQVDDIWAIFTSYMLVTLLLYPPSFFYQHSLLHLYINDMRQMIFFKVLVAFQRLCNTG